MGILEDYSFIGGIADINLEGAVKQSRSFFTSAPVSISKEQSSQQYYTLITVTFAKVHIFDLFGHLQLKNYISVTFNFSSFCILRSVNVTFCLYRLFVITRVTLV